VEWIVQELPEWFEECVSYKEDFMMKFNSYKAKYFTEEEENQIGTDGKASSWIYSMGLF
jgi:hypothetical protein